MVYCKVIFDFPAQKYCHPSNVMFIFLKRNQKNIKRGDIKRKKVSNGNNILNFFFIFFE